MQTIVHYYMRWEMRKDKINCGKRCRVENDPALKKVRAKVTCLLDQ